MHSLEVVGLGAAVIVIASVGNYLLRNTAKRKSSVTYHYVRKSYLMTRSEHDFFEILLEAAGPGYYIFPQIHLSAILDHKVKTGVWQNWDAAFRHINGKSVDYVICDKANIKPVLAIELDGWNHSNDKTKKRDVEVERILSEAGLPLIRFTETEARQKESVTTRLSQTLSM